MRAIATAPHEFDANLLFNEQGLQPFFGADATIKQGDGSVVGDFHDQGEHWVAKLSYQDSNIQHPGEETPNGTPFHIETIREYRLKVARHPDEDDVGQQDFTAHLAPRWQGMQGENRFGDLVDITVPENFGEGVNVRIQGSNIEFSRYRRLLAFGFSAVGLNATYFTNPHPSSNIQDAERYVRIDRTESGPLHARDGTITSLGHLLENDRTGYRKLVQNDQDEHGNTLPGYYHTATLDPRRIQEAWPHHELAKEIKHYYAREAHKFPDDHPLSHPKLGASYQTKRHDDTLYWDDLDQLDRELDETVLSCLQHAGIDTSPTHGTGPYIEDAYFDVGTIDRDYQPLGLELTRIRQEQESVVVRHLADGLSPVQWESLQQLVTDGGQVSPTAIAEMNDRHVDSVRRALRDMEDLVDRKYGEVGLKSDYIAELVRDAVTEAREGLRKAVSTASRAIEMASRGASQTMAEWVAFCDRYGIDISNRTDALELELGNYDPDADTSPSMIMQLARDVWRDAGQDLADLRAATVIWRRPDGLRIRRKGHELLI